MSFRLSPATRPDLAPPCRSCKQRAAAVVLTCAANGTPRCERKAWGLCLRCLDDLAAVVRGTGNVTADRRHSS